MISIPSYQATTPGDTARAWEGGFGQGASAFSEGQRLKQGQVELQQRQQALDLDKQRFIVDATIAKQKQELATQAAARQYQALGQYQSAIASGVDPVQAAMMYGPAMSGGKMTGYAPVFSDWQKSHAPAFTPTEIKDASGKTIGYADHNGAVHYIPQPKAPPPQYKTTTVTTPGTPTIPGSQAIPSDYKWYDPTTWGDKDVPAKAAIPGSPRTSVSTRVPIDPVLMQSTTNSPTIKQPMALPDTESDLQEGQLYQTKYGPATWTGTNFVSQ